MSTRPKGETTLPVQSVIEAAAAKVVLGIRWLFPTEDGDFTAFAKTRILFGRDPNCDGPLPGQETSREHAEVVRDGPIWVLRDLESTNGVHVNGLPSMKAALRSGDVVRMGDWVGVVVSAPQAASKAPVFECFAERLFGGPVLRLQVELTRRAAQSDLPIVIEGETGTGKEGLARAIHVWSNRAGPFHAVNCAALPENLAEAELFGYRKGAFTGADRASLGHFRSAHGGTLLLDEIIDMPLSVQAKLLRVLEQREVLPLGESQPVAVDVRVVAATQVPLSQAAGENFRHDLAARLEGLVVHLPPLRERKEEIPYLFMQLLKQHSGGAAPAVRAKLIEQLCLYDWPSNVRELDLLVRRLLVLHGQETALRRTHLPPRMLDSSASRLTGAGPNLPESRDERDLEALVAELRRNGGVLARAAKTLNVSRQRAYRLLEGRAALEESREGPKGVE